MFCVQKNDWLNLFQEQHWMIVCFVIVNYLVLILRRQIEHRQGQLGKRANGIKWNKGSGRSVVPIKLITVDEERRIPYGYQSICCPAFPMLSISGPSAKNFSQTCTIPYQLRHETIKSLSACFILILWNIRYKPWRANNRKRDRKSGRQVENPRKFGIGKLHLWSCH